jgi:single-strand DNA-binding protein
MSIKDNHITITGNLGRDAEVRYTKSGKPVSSFSMGHTPRVKSGDEWVDGETLWFKVTVWDNLPEIIFTKGAGVIVTGELRQESWENEAGETRTGLTIVASSVGLIHRVMPLPETTAPSAQVWPAANYIPNEDTPF